MLNFKSIRLIMIKRLKNLICQAYTSVLSACTSNCNYKLIFSFFYIVWNQELD